MGVAVSGSRRRRLLLEVGLALVSTAVALSLGELVSRAMSGRLLNLSNPLVRFDPELGWVYHNGRILSRTNEAGTTFPLPGNPLGFRDGGRKLEPTSGKVLVVGDSFTAGTQVPQQDVWPALLEKRLRAWGLPHQVVNAGVDGYDLAQDYRLARRFVPRFRPVVLVLGLYVGNDIVDYDQDAQARPPWIASGPLGWVSDHSYLFHVVRGGFRTLAETRTAQRLRGAELPPFLASFDPRQLPGLSQATPLEAERVRGQFQATELVRLVRGGAGAERALASTMRMVQEFRSLASAHCASFLLVLLPAKVQAVPGFRDAWVQLQGLEGGRVAEPQRWLRAACESGGIAVVDLLPPFTTSDHPEHLYWRVDLHLSEAGNRKAAEEVASAFPSLGSGCPQHTRSQ